MALPSSPPLLSEHLEEPPSSPLLPTISTHTQTRKRHFCEYDNLSSDPLFSDDTSGAEDVTGYERPKRKRMVKGPWWSLGKRSDAESKGHSVQKEPLRNADSGVWMGSDGSEESTGSFVSSGGRPQRLPVSDGHALRATKRAQSSVEELALSTVNECVENGKETVDLSDMNLGHLSSATLRPLHELIRQPQFDPTQPPSEGEFNAFTPAIQLYLSRNHLTALPSELFRLENVTVLSLRNNALAELPSFIGRLRRLKELNIAGNAITCLPWEVLALLDCRGTHRTINVRPNPLIEPTRISGASSLPALTADARTSNEELGRLGDTRAYFESLREAYLQQAPLDMRSELELRLKLGRALRNQYLKEASRAGQELDICKEELIYLAASPVRFFDVDGRPLRKEDGDGDTAPILSTEYSLKHHRDSIAPSLFELSMRAAQQHFDLQDIPSGLPTQVATALRIAASCLEYGNPCCSFCSKPFILARAQWIEYWYNGFPSQAELTQETVLPFIRRVCSWECARPSEAGTFKCC